MRKTAILIICLSSSLSLLACRQKTSEPTANPEQIPPAAQEPASAQALIRETFADYQTAIQSNQGQAALELVDSRTIAYYSQMLELIIHADQAELQNQTLIDQLLILLVRQQIPQETILAMDGKQLFIYAIDQGMTGKDSVTNLSLGTITVLDDYAKTEILTAGQPSAANYDFYLVDTGWKLDLTSNLPVANLALNTLLAESAQTPTDFLLSLLQLSTGTQPETSIWDPLL